MARNIVEVCVIERTLPHSNADRLMLAHVKGWQFVIPKKEDGSPQFSLGEKVVYIPIDSVLSREFADKIGVTNYLSEKTDCSGNRVLVVRQARLRGEPSFGIVIRPEDASWPVGHDVAEHYGIEKYLAPIKTTAGDQEEDHPLFWKYTDIENMRNFPDILQPDERVVITEKIHGTNCRVGWIDGQLMAGSAGLRRKEPGDFGLNTYWFPLSIPEVKELIEKCGAVHQAILFGEVFGSKVQSLHYGERGTLGFRAFDLLIDGKFLDHDLFRTLCEMYGVKMVPILDECHFSLEAVRKLSAGPTTLGDSTHIREGVVVKPVVERVDPRIGRVILKYISDDYLLAKGISDSQDV